jgi:hypothetical protein
VINLLQTLPLHDITVVLANGVIWRSGGSAPNNQPMNRKNQIIPCELLLCLFGAHKGYG